jgi:DNA helicase II / ATP-dependent DNA helicase PcrA
VVRAVLAARETGELLRRQAVLFRASHHSDRLELELVRRNIPFVKYGGLKFLEAGACEGPAGGAAVGRQSAQPDRRLSHLAIVAGGRASSGGEGLCLAGGACLRACVSRRLAAAAAAAAFWAGLAELL